MSKQRIMHGATIDTATPDEVGRIIAAAFGRQQSHDYTRRKGAVALTAAGTAAQAIETVPPRYDWLCERVAIVAAPNAVVSFFENDTSGPNLLESVVIPASGNYSDSFANNLYLPSNTELILVIAGGAAGGQVSYNIQVRLVERPQ